jgi:hypothetical protein
VHSKNYNQPNVLTIKRTKRDGHKPCGCHPLSSPMILDGVMHMCKANKISAHEACVYLASVVSSSPFEWKRCCLIENTIFTVAHCYMKGL